MARIILLNKPFQVLCQFRANDERTTLKRFLPNQPGFHPAGRLDYDSEGLLLLTDDGALQHRIAHPDKKLPKTYWVQVEGIPDDEAIAKLCKGVELKDGMTRPAQAKRINPPKVWERHPPIRERASIPDQWLEITISEGRNRQVRRMTAAVGHPTLRLIRASIGQWKLGDLLPGEWRMETVHLPTPAKRPSAKRPPAKRTQRRRR